MARKGDAPDRMNTEEATTTKRRYQRPRTPPQQQQAQPDDQQAQQDRRDKGQHQRRREGEPDWQPGADSPTDTGSEVDLQTASREELEALAFELDIDAFGSMDREELVSEIEERS